MSFAIQRLRALLPGQQQPSNYSNNSTSFEPEIGFQISLESCEVNADHKIAVPELNVHLIAARHLPTLFGFKIVQGYLIKVKMFPGSKRLDSTVQTNSWPKFNENFRFSLQPEHRSSLKHTSSSRRNSKSAIAAAAELIPAEIFAGQFVVFTVYALLELPPMSFNRINRTYRSIRDKSSNFVQKMVETKSNSRQKDDRRDSQTSNNCNNINNNNNNNGIAKTEFAHPSLNAPAPPPLTFSEAKRNIGSVTCYLEPKIFKRNTRTGLYTTDELWLPIKDINSTAIKESKNNVTNASKGVVEIVLELRDQSSSSNMNDNNINNNNNNNTTENNNSGVGDEKQQQRDKGEIMLKNISNNMNKNNNNSSQWNRMTAEMKRKMGISNVDKLEENDLLLSITTLRMRCSNKVKDELESTAGSVYVKTTVFEHDIYLDSWKSDLFYPTLSVMWDKTAATGSSLYISSPCTINIPLKSRSTLENILIRTTLATKTKLNKKLVLGTVSLAATPAAVRGCNTGLEHMQQLIQTANNERIAKWHGFQ